MSLSSEATIVGVVVNEGSNASYAVGGSSGSGTRGCGVIHTITEI